MIWWEWILLLVQGTLHDCSSAENTDLGSRPIIIRPRDDGGVEFDVDGEQKKRGTTGGED